MRIFSSSEGALYTHNMLFMRIIRWFRGEDGQSATHIRTYVPGIYE